MPRRPPVRRFGQAKPDVPLWRRGKVQRAQQSEKDAIAKAVAAHLARQGSAPAPASGVNKFPGTTGAYRFRYQLVPLLWLGAVVAVGLSAHAHHAPWQGLVLGLVAALGILGLTRHTKGFARKAAQWIAGLTAFWVAALSLGAASWGIGHVHPFPPLGLICWVCVLVPWVKHYRIRQDTPAAPVPVKTTDYEIWAKLAAKRKWTGHLGMPEALPDGGKRYPITLDGSETDIGEVLAHPRKIAAAWGKSITEAYAEPSPDGIESKGRLTLLTRGTLEKTREWDSAGIDPEGGMATVAHFPDGQPVHERYFIRRNGVRHTIIAGADGSGKTGLLDLGLCLSATSGLIAPVVLDPQEGQALPAWREHIPYACGVEECLVYLRGLHAGMLAQSGYLADLTWEDEEGRTRRGMGFFDPFMTGLSITEVTMDESPALLTDPKAGPEAVRLTGDTGKRGRKAGYRLRLAAQVPSLSELGDQALRSMLVGGNVFCFRTGDRVSGGMVGLAADPHELPKYFSDRSPTVGLGYTSGPDNRPGTPMRTLWVKDPERVAEKSQIRGLNPLVAAALDRAVNGRGTALPVRGPASSLAAVPQPEEDETAPGGRTASDAILAVLDSADGPLERGEIVKRTGLLVKQWGREKPFSVKAQGNALKTLTEAGKICKTEHGTYAAARASLHVVGAEGSTS